MTHPIYIIDRAGHYRQVSYLSADEQRLAIDPWAVAASDLPGSGFTRPLSAAEPLDAPGPEVHT